MVHKGQHIELTVKKRTIDQPGLVSVCFERPANFSFDAGDWIDLQFANTQLRGGITYSLSSAPTEPDLRITFKEGLSEFKRMLQAVTPGERAYITQYGNDYDFNIKQHQSSVLIAGGVGIAPFRSMLKEAFDLDQNNTMSLIYLNQTSEFLFAEELNTWADALPGVTINYIVTKELNRKKREKHLLATAGPINQNFYISGPPAMVENTEHLLIDHGVSIKKIRIDSFGGY